MEHAIAKKGDLLFSDEFDSIPTVVRDGRFFVKSKQGLWELYEARENPTRIGGKYSMVSSFNRGVAIVAEKGQPVSIINTKGEVVKLLDRIDGEEVLYVRPFKNGYARFRTTEGLLGAIDKKGNCVVEPKYVFLSDCADGKFIGVEKKYHSYVGGLGGAFAIINEADEYTLYVTDIGIFVENPLLPSVFDRDARFYMDMEERDNIKVSVLDTKGKVILELPGSEYTDVGTIADGLLAVCVEKDDVEAWGIINDKGKVVLKPSEDIKQIGSIYGDKFTYRDDNGWGLMDITGQELIRSKYEELWHAGSHFLLAAYFEKSPEAPFGRKLMWKYIDEEDDCYRSGLKYVSLFSNIDGKHVVTYNEANRWRVLWYDVTIDTFWLGEKNLTGGWSYCYQMNLSGGDEYIACDSIVEVYSTIDVTAGT